MTSPPRLPPTADARGELMASPARSADSQRNTSRAIRPASSVWRAPGLPSGRRIGGKRGGLGAALAAAALAVAGCTAGAIAQSTPLSNGTSFIGGSATTLYSPGSRPAAPDVHGRTLSGSRLALSSYRGHVVVLNFWGSWCTPCRAEAPVLAQLSRQFRPKGVRFIGVDIRDSPASADAFVRNFRIGYPSLNDPGDQVALAFSGTVPPTGIPTTLVIDRSGGIAARVVGGVSYAGLKHLITQVSAERA